ncbi:alpha/beta hydrolase [Leuconostoc suionicum]|uniref:alpha/beta fold hydrolase n=1 Tax=Leuconostoc suionicum TaxID=1511761 RepID=UPI0021A99117|nr:alpha/beta hydrolase [Leuconostoc suionicum]MCT4381660.1 alpha/beta hydrolase [Leuconostoc suionicum]
MSFKQYTENQQFNLQINRFVNDFYESDERVSSDLEKIVPNLTDTESWYAQWNNMAEYRESIGDLDLASIYYQASEFYLSLEDPKENLAYSKYKKLFYETYTDWNFEYNDVPYGDSSLPSVKLITPNAKETLVVFAGYDSFMEEMVKAMSYLKDIAYNIIIFDGPGQGGALRRGLKLVAEWENPVKTIFDFYKLNNATILGVSFGGYLAMRAAAFEKRINKVICFDIFYSFFDTLKMSTSANIYSQLLNLLNNDKRVELDNLVYRLMRKSIDFEWKISKGMANTGATTPYSLLKEFKKYDMTDLGEHINQEVLLLAGSEDQYIPLSRIYQIQKELKNAKTITSIIFNSPSGGEQHCQAGHRELAFDAIKKFLA